MKLKILRVNVKSEEGLNIFKPNDKVVESSKLEDYRKSLKKNPGDSVLFSFEEIGDE